MGVEFEMNGSTGTDGRYVGWAPAPCRVRLNPPTTSAVTVTLTDGGGVGQVVFYKTLTSASTSTLSVKLPASGAWVDLGVGGRFGHASVEDRDAVIVIKPSARRTLPLPFPVFRKELLRVRLMVRIRKNANKLTDAERDRFLAALATVNNAGAGLYQSFRDMHVAASNNEAHGRAGFLPWHRSFLLDLERELQKVDPSVALPYWRFDEAAEKVLSDTFMGETNGPSGTLPFSASNPLQFFATDGVSGIQRDPDFDPATGHPALSTQAQTLALGTTFAAFRGLEGDPHGSAHVSFNGYIDSIPTAVKDPLFFLLHCNVDRLWALWQWLGDHFDQADAASYDSAVAPATNRIGHNLVDTMWPWNGITGAPRPPTAPGGGLATSPAATAPGGTPTVGSMLDYAGHVAHADRLGFDYDDVPYAKFKLIFPRPTLLPAAFRTSLTAELDAVERARAELLPDQDALTASTESADAPTRARAHRALGAHIERSDGAFDLLLRRLVDRGAVPADRLAAFAGIQAQSFQPDSFARHRPAWLATLRTLVDDPVQRLRRAALGVLKAEKDGFVEEVLLRGLRDPAQAVVPPEEALTFLGSDVHAEVAELARAIEAAPPSPGARLAALRVLAADASSRPRFERILVDKAESAEVRRLAITALHAIDPDNVHLRVRSVVDAKDEDSDVRATALSALAASPVPHADWSDAALRSRVDRLRSSGSRPVRQAASRLHARIKE